MRMACDKIVDVPGEVMGKRLCGYNTLEHEMVVVVPIEEIKRRCRGHGKLCGRSIGRGDFLIEWSICASPFYELGRRR